jgi:uncharacterized protein HemY
MKSLEPPDQHNLKAAEGWLQLGNVAEAKHELEQIHPKYHRHPAVLDVAWQVYAQEKMWDICLSLAEALVEVAPDIPSGWIHRSFTLHELKRTQEAWDRLLPVADRFQEEPIISYNLACYACQLQQVDTAREWLQKAMRAGDPPRIMEMALADPDLKPLWGEIRTQLKTE